MKNENKQVGGTHYVKMRIQPSEFIRSNDLKFCEGNIIKYVCRYESKNGIEDLQKARELIRRRQSKGTPA